jgi:hypothetical protein
VAVHAGRAQDESENTGELPWVSKGKSSSTFLECDLTESCCVCVWCNSPLVSEQVYVYEISFRGVLACCVFEMRSETDFRLMDLQQLLIPNGSTGTAYV